MKLFVSYRRAAWSFTYWLAEELGKLLDAEIFVDFSGIDEANFENSLLRNLRESDAVLVVLTAETFDPERINDDKDWVRREIREALRLKKPIALALHNGLTPPTDLPTDIQRIRNMQGIEFYPRFFKAGVRELAAFIDRATPIKLVAPLVNGPPAGEAAIPDEAAPSDGAVFDRATALAEAGKYDDALKLLTMLKERGYSSKYFDMERIIATITRDRDAEQRHWNAGQSYDQIAALARIDVRAAFKAWVQFRAEFPDYTDDPAQLAQKLLLLVAKQPVPASSVTPATPSTPPTSNRDQLKQSVIGGVVGGAIGGIIWLLYTLFGTPSSGITTPSPSPSPAVAVTAPVLTKNADWMPQVVTIDGVEMVRVPAGCFMMGLDGEGSMDREIRPAHKVCIQREFLLDRLEVSNAQFFAFAGRAKQPSHWTVGGRPRETITWVEAHAYCTDKRNGRLPTEAEWEWAARGPENWLYPWGSDFVAANTIFVDTSPGSTADVGSRPEGRSWVGALDLSGNVWEWTSSLYRAYPVTPDDGREDVSDQTSDRALRGGSAETAALEVRAVSRLRLPPDNVRNYLGFRCARDG